MPGLPIDPTQRAVDLFGATTDPWAAGWVLPDGRMLDLLRRKDMAGILTHPETADAIFGTTNRGIDAAMKAGWVRISQEDHLGYPMLGFEVVAPLTPAQRSTLRSAATQAPRVIFDWRGEGEHWSSRDLPAAPLIIAQALRELDARSRGEWPGGRSVSAESWAPPERRLLDSYGPTEDPFEAGWMFRDGTMVQMSPGERRLTPHHLMASCAFGCPDGAQVLIGPRRQDDPIRLALEAGWVRIMCDHEQELDFEMALPPTDAQRRRIRTAAKEAATVAIEMVEAADSSHSRYWSGRLPGSATTVARALRRAERALDGLEAPTAGLGLAR